MPATRPRRRVWIRVIAPVLLLISLLAWGLSSAVGSSPDDDFHLSSIWCGSGATTSSCAPATEPDQRSVGIHLLVDSVCFAFNADASASCQGNALTTDTGELTATDRGNFSGLYPPVFYWTMSWLSSPNIEASVLAMRSLNALLFVAMTTALAWLLPRWRRPTLVATVAATLVPLTAFLVPSTNPNSWALISATVVWIALLGYFETTGRRRIGLAAVAAVAALLGSGARADAALFVIVAVGLVGILTVERTRAYLRRAIFPAVLAVLAAVVVLVSRQSGAIVDGLGPGDRSDPLSLALLNLSELPSLWVGAYGFWNLGWLDTRMPVGVWAPAFLVFCGALFLGLQNPGRRKAIAIALLGAALVIYPMVLLLQSGSPVGANFQPRYLLPLLIMFVGVLLLREPGDPARPPRAAVVLAGVSLVAANAIALHSNIRRYVTGIDQPGGNLDRGAEWWWQLPISPMTVWAIGAIAFATLVALLVHRALTRDLPEVPATVLSRRRPSATQAP